MDEDERSGRGEGEEAVRGLEPTPEAVELLAEGGAASAPRPTGRVLATAGVSAAVLIFALVFFMSGFVAHAILDDDPGSKSAEAAGSAALADDPSWGPDDAAVTIEAFSDFQCPYCKQFAEDTLPRLKDEYGDRVHFIFRDLPLTNIHPAAALAAQAGGCAQEQGRFWEYHDLLYSNQETLSEATITDYAGDAGLDISQFNECLTSNEKMVDVLLDMQDAERQGVRSTPSFVINGLMVAGAQPYELFAALIDQALGAD